MSRTSLSQTTLIVIQDMLQRAGDYCTHDEVKNRWQQEPAFYQAWAQNPAQLYACRLLLQDYNELMEYVQNRLNNIIFADFTAKAKLGINVNEQIDSPAQVMIHSLQTDLEKGMAINNEIKANWQALAKTVNQAAKQTLAEKPSVETLLLASRTMQPQFEKLTQSIQTQIQQLIRSDKYIDAFLEQFPDPMRSRELNKQNQMAYPDSAHTIEHESTQLKN